MPAAQLIVVLSEYRRVGYGVQPGENLLLSMRDPLRVDDQVSVIDRGPRRERRDARQHFAERKSVHENKFDPVLELLGRHDETRSPKTSRSGHRRSPLRRWSCPAAFCKMFSKVARRSVETETVVSLAVSVASLIALASRAAKMTGVEGNRSRLWR